MERHPHGDARRVSQTSAAAFVLLVLFAAASVAPRCTPVPVEPPRDTSCDDGTVPLCNHVPPVCSEHELLAHQDDCYVCVNPATCRPWGKPGCEGDVDCAVSHVCDACATSSCPVCSDCVAACMPHGCPTEPTLTCRCVRPECGESGVAVIRDGCWVCIDRGTCERQSASTDCMTP